MSEGMVRKWATAFKYGRTSVHDEERSGRPSVINEDLVLKVGWWKSSKENRRFTISSWSNEFPQVSGSVLYGIVTQHLNYRPYIPTQPTGGRLGSEFVSSQGCTSHSFLQMIAKNRQHCVHINSKVFAFSELCSTFGYDCTEAAAHSPTRGHHEYVDEKSPHNLIPTACGLDKHRVARGSYLWTVVGGIRIVLRSYGTWLCKYLGSARVNGCNGAVWPLYFSFMRELFTATAQETTDALTSPRATSILPVPTMGNNANLGRNSWKDRLLERSLRRFISKEIINLARIHCFCRLLQQVPFQ
ncbi:hypothetical protein AVEN_145593-1 [Araneus ventricosus]|uniref:Uncharacterized protein n=1 Tax=Araneus ventricosus TaxID=182803 RepID=A0A4Y2S4P5_ARAVE|nr:hypothetical protein AVEN_145593-1 [Araneus ventricosus]